MHEIISNYLFFIVFHIEMIIRKKLKKIVIFILVHYLMFTVSETMKPRNDNLVSI